MKRSLTKIILASSLFITALGNAQSQKVTAIDNVAVKMGVKGDTATYLAMEVLGKLDSKQRVEKLNEEENNLKILQSELTKEEAKLAAAQNIMLENNVKQTAYTLTTPLLFVSGAVALGTGLWSTNTFFDGYNTSPKVNKVFWTSALVGAITYASKKFISTEVTLQRDQVAQLKASVENIRSQANKVQEVIEILKKFYRIDIDVNVNVKQ